MKSLDKLLYTLYEAEEVQVVKDGDLKLPVNELVVTNYDKIIGYAGRARKPMVDWVTEYNYVSEKSLTPHEWERLLKENGHELTGQVYAPTKRKLTYGDGKVLYRHTQIAVAY